MSIDTPAGSPVASVYLSGLLGGSVNHVAGKTLGRLRDVVVRLADDDYPRLRALVVAVGSKAVFVPVTDVVDLAQTHVTLRTSRLDVRPFERRPGEVLLAADVLGHRLIDLENADFVRARDALLRRDDASWIVSGLDVRRRRWLPRAGQARSTRDWKSFEALIGHAPSLLFRSAFGRVRRFRPAEIADLLENATPDEQTELLAQVHSDPELEADVFEELDEDQQARLLRDRPIEEVAHVLTRMRLDDAADAIADLPQARRAPVLDLMPAAHRGKIIALLGFAPTTAGGLMTPDFIALSETATIGEALDRIRNAVAHQPEALTSVFTLDAGGRLAGAASVVTLLQHDASAALSDIANASAIRVGPGDDIVTVTTRMADFNLLTLPVVDESGTLIGVVTVDDALEAAIPDDWRRRTGSAPQPTTNATHETGPSHVGHGSGPGL
ncbi:magnesium transporter MgtE N-terminal domain-containing protein [Amnibacterium sp.]|uniref:magnesium transporter MgtE N-terminal domain-containing protein n=1 Tax=Amnibacterium sp. TaxID=1872496 RepID=UPI003F7B5750